MKENSQYYMLLKMKVKYFIFLQLYKEKLIWYITKLSYSDKILSEDVRNLIVNNAIYYYRFAHK